MSNQNHGDNADRVRRRDAARRKLAKRGITPASMKGATISKPDVGDGNITVDDLAKVKTVPNVAPDITTGAIKSAIKRN